MLLHTNQEQEYISPNLLPGPSAVVGMRNNIKSLSILSFIDLHDKIHHLMTVNLFRVVYLNPKSLHVLEAKQVGELCQAVLRHRLQVGAEGPHDGLHCPLPNLKFKFSASLLICADRNFESSAAIIRKCHIFKLDSTTPWY